MTRTKYPDKFKEQVVREILEKERTIASVAASYDTFCRTTSVVWKRCYINYFGDFDTCTVYGSDSRFKTVTWTLHVSFCST